MYLLQIIKKISAGGKNPFQKKISTQKNSFQKKNSFSRKRGFLSCKKI